jgi:hypothetical protein
VSLASSLGETGIEDRDPALYLFLKSLALAIDRLNVNFSLSYDQPTALQNQSVGAAGVDVAASIGPDVLVVNAIRFLGDRNGLLLDSSRAMGCAIYFGTAQVIPTGAGLTLFQFPAGELWDTDDMHDPVVNNSRLTIRHAGTYVIGARIDADISGAGTYREMWIGLNGGAAGYPDVDMGNPNTGQYVRLHCTTIAQFIVGDYIEVSVRHDAGGDLTFTPRAFWAHRIS